MIIFLEPLNHDHKHIMVLLLKGYFRALFTCIEQLLVSMNVEKIVLPAAEDAESIWTKTLGFKKISDEQVSI